jgi:hypothetical protein
LIVDEEATCVRNSEAFSEEHALVKDADPGDEYGSTPENPPLADDKLPPYSVEIMVDTTIDSTSSPGGHQKSSADSEE